MPRLRLTWWRRRVGAIGVMGMVLALGGLATGATPYVMTNDDPGVSVYTVAPDGLLTFKQSFQLGGFGNVGGYFGSSRISGLDAENQQCVFAAIPSTGEVGGIVVSTMTVSGSFPGSPTDSG
ncbi:MAG: hypothetical protein WCF48_09130, partial [Terriglobales bacterium]